MSKKEKPKVQRVSIPCVFRGRNHSRKFTTPGNFEAFNLLMHKLDRKGVKSQLGKLVFEFDPSLPEFDSREFHNMEAAKRGELLVLKSKLKSEPKPKRRKNNG